MLDLQIKVRGGVTKALTAFPRLCERARKSALSSTGFHVQQDLKRAGKEIEPKLNPHTGVLSVTHDTAKRFGRNVKSKGNYGGTVGTGKFNKEGREIRRKVRNAHEEGQRGQVVPQTSTRLNPFSRFVSMVRYDTDAEDNLVEIGILKPKPAYFKWMRMNVAGFETPVTSRMRRFLFALGFPIKKETTTLQTPSRAWFAPVREKWNRKGGPFFEMQFWNALDRYRSRSGGGRLYD